MKSSLRSASTWVTSRVAASSCLSLRRGRRWCATAGPGPRARPGPRPGCRRRSRTARRRSSAELVGVDLARRSSTGRRTPRRRRTARRCAPAGSARRGRAPVAARDEREELRAEHRLDLDRGRGAVADEASLTPELDGAPRRPPARGLDLADLDAGDADRVVGLQAGGLGELRLVDGAAADERQRLRVERAGAPARGSRARLTAPMTTGLRSRNGLGLAGHQLHPSAPLRGRHRDGRPRLVRRVTSVGQD